MIFLQSSSPEPQFGLIAIQLILRIVGIIVCSSKATSLNRSAGGWGFFGFAFPIVAMIWVNCLKPNVVWDNNMDKNNKA